MTYCHASTWPGVTTLYAQPMSCPKDTTDCMCVIHDVETHEAHSLSKIWCTLTVVLMQHSHFGISHTDWYLSSSCIRWDLHLYSFAFKANKQKSNKMVDSNWLCWYAKGEFIQSEKCKQLSFGHSMVVFMPIYFLQKKDWL